MATSLLPLPFNSVRNLHWGPALSNLHSIDDTDQVKSGPVRAKSVSPASIPKAEIETAPGAQT